MTGFVVDNSVVMAWALTDEASGYADSVLASLDGAPASVPVVWPLEVANVLAVAERRQRLTPGDSLRFLALLEALPISVVADIDMASARHLFTLARQFELSAYDASYLALCLRLGLPLASQDASLRRAAVQAGVKLWLL